ncbi:MAG: 30S ribosome-binding factor RbfA [Nitrospirae bacterium]|nr:MAG: 30S ribosome-binding factor RbfA [Nitrospirota bacterium]
MRYTSDTSRLDRLNALLVELLAELLQRGLKDPRVHDVTVTGAEVAPDLRHARVFVSCLAGEAGWEEVHAGLVAATPYLRARLGKMMRVKRIPELDFRYDTSLEAGARMEALFEAIHREEEGDG